MGYSKVRLRSAERNKSSLTATALNSQLLTGLMDKYPGWSPYNYVMGNTLNSFDPDGRDVIVLLAPNGASWAGHAALLIGNETKGWVYISKNGVEEGEKATHGKPDVTYLTQWKGETFNQFLSVVEDKDDQDYKLGYWMISDTEQDTKMINAALTNVEELYKLLTNNCMDVVTNALESAGLNGGHVEIPMNSNGISSGVKYKDYHPVPKIRYQVIKACNDSLKMSVENSIEMSVKVRLVDSNKGVRKDETGTDNESKRNRSSKHRFTDKFGSN